MIYFTSDLHFGHKNIINFCRRPFHSVENMNKLMVMNWNEVVQPDDTVYILGDFAMGQIRETLPIAEQLNGEKLLVPGNHDRCWPGHLDGDGKIDGAKISEWKQRYEDVGFTVLPTQVTIEHEGQEILLCHFPYETVVGEYDLRYHNTHPVDNGLPLFHGHVHDTWKTRLNMVNVGVDVWGYCPVSIERLVDVLSPV